MRRIVVVSITAWIALAVSGVASPAATAVDQPVQAPQNLYLEAVSASSSTDVWMVGDGPHGIPPTYHWDGSTLTRGRAAGVAGARVHLAGVDALTSTNVWAVGGSTNETSARPLLEHWNGVTWSIIRLPAGVQTNQINAIGGPTQLNLWAVGDLDAATGGPLILHRTSAGWIKVPAPGEGAVSYLSSVTVLSPRNVWASGSWNNGQYDTHALLEHWDGTRWSIVDGAQLDGQNQLFDISADAADDVWAVGEQNVSEDHADSVIEHFDGSAWTQVAGPEHGDYNTIYIVAAVAPDDVFTSDPYRGMQQWNGSTWAPEKISVYVDLFAGFAISGTDAWAVGVRIKNGTQPAAVHWDGTKWRLVLP